MRFKFLLFVTALAFLVPAAKSQTISPVWIESSVKPGKTVRGSFQFQNNLLVPAAVTVEPLEFYMEDGKSRSRPLPPSTHVELGESSSLRLGAKEIYTWDYKINCDTPSCIVVFKVSEIAGKTVDGLTVKVILPTLVYIGTTKHPRADYLRDTLVAKK